MRPLTEEEASLLGLRYHKLDSDRTEARRFRRTLRSRWRGLVWFVTR
jgi:hypothetical protein